MNVEEVLKAKCSRDKAQLDFIFSDDLRIFVLRFTI